MLTLHNTDALPTDPDLKLWLYNGLDCCVTRDVFSQLNQQRAEPTYTFSRRALAPALSMMFHGMPVDIETQKKVIETETEKAERYFSLLNLFAEAIWDKPLAKKKLPSPKVLAEFFYDYLDLPSSRKRDKLSGKMKPTVDKHALKKLATHTYARPFVNLIFELRKANKLLSIPKSVNVYTKKFNFSINVAGTETGRFSSSDSAFGEGSNVFNITKSMREMFVPDQGYVLGYADLRAAEAVVVAYLGDDDKFIEVANSADFHTAVAREVWPSMPWTGDLKKDRVIADRRYEDTHLSYRDFTKRIDFGTHYDGTAAAMSALIGIDKLTISLFQNNYHNTFPGIRKFQHDVLTELYETGELVTPHFKRRRKFYGSLSDSHTKKEAYAYKPQSMVADIVTTALVEAHDKLCPRGLVLLNSLYDALTFQVPIGEEHLASELVSLMERPIVMPSGKTMTIRASYKLGKNWKEIS